MIQTPDGRNLTTCIFDLDETLYPRACGVMTEIGARIQRYMIDKLGFDEALVPGLRRDLYIRYGTALRGLQVEHSVDAEDYLAYVHAVDLARLLRQAPDLNQMLDAMPLDKVVFTNANREHAERVLAQLGIRRHFTRVVDLRDIDYRCKPDPHAYQRLLELIGQPAGVCVYVEDTPRNLRPAVGLGMVTVLVDPLDQDCGGFDYCVPSMMQIGNVIESLRTGRKNGHAH